MKKELSSRIKAVWLIVVFDLPVQTKKQRKNYVHFRKFLINQGFSMLQFSVYAEYFPSRERMETIIRRIENTLPPEGQVRTFWLTERQFQEMKVFYGASEISPEEPPESFLFL